MCVTCVPQKRRNHDGWREGVHEMMDGVLMDGVYSGHQLGGNEPYGLLGCFEPSLTQRSTNIRRADYSNGRRLHGYWERPLT